MVDITDLSYLKAEQDSTDSAQDIAMDLKADIIYVDTELANKASVNINMRGSFDATTSALYLSLDGTDPTPP